MTAVPARPDQRTVAARASVLRMGLGARLAVAAVACALLWAAVAWSLLS